MARRATTELYCSYPNETSRSSFAYGLSQSFCAVIEDIGGKARVYAWSITNVNARRVNPLQSILSARFSGHGISTEQMSFYILQKRTASQQWHIVAH